ncbi:hypothetical protein FQA39_LY04040 [Lamprigera yunnana]|nr:hypothetical protein FQA39_LY04039 [Lamprigera yunnana]KAF5288272.1 hypothetical protein FQA39_LY04040 [Lamprigera yunnana]
MNRIHEFIQPGNCVFALEKDVSKAALGLQQTRIDMDIFTARWFYSRRCCNIVAVDRKDQDALLVNSLQLAFL